MDSQINIKRSMEWKEFETTFSVKLNQQQKEAVQSTKGPVLLLAVPGSGKTTVLVTRLGYMIYCRNIPPESILTVTYTVAATKDMSERLQSVLARIWQRDWNLGRSTESVRGLSSITEDGLERHHSNW